MVLSCERLYAAVCDSDLSFWGKGESVLPLGVERMCWSGGSGDSGAGDDCGVRSMRSNFALGLLEYGPLHAAFHRTGRL